MPPPELEVLPVLGPEIWLGLDPELKVCELPLPPLLLLKLWLELPPELKLWLPLEKLWLPPELELCDE